MKNEKQTFAEFRDSMRIRSTDCDTASVDRAIQLDVEANESMMLEAIADLIQAARNGADAAELARHAHEITTEFDLLTQVDGFEQDPAGDIIARAQLADLEAMPIEGMGRA